jgi:hypothetical protein
LARRDEACWILMSSQHHNNEQKFQDSWHIRRGAGLAGPRWGGSPRDSLRENRRLPCVIMFAVRFILGRTAKPFFAVRHSFSARQTFTHGNYTLCRAFSKGRTAKENLCRTFFRDARQSVFANATTPGPSLLLTDVNLCRASSQNARQRRIVCRAFYVGAR